MSKKITQKQCIDRFMKKHGNRYDYSSVNYKHGKCKVRIVCHDHGEFFQSPGRHWRGHGCPKCGLIKKAKSRYNGYELISGTFWRNIKNNALKRGILFNLDIKYAWDVFEMQDRKCSLSGIPIMFRTENRNGVWINTASLDRIDSKKGYIIGNIQWLHKDVNKIKNEFSQKEFISMCGEIYEWNKKQIL